MFKRTLAACLLLTGLVRPQVLKADLSTMLEMAAEDEPVVDFESVSAFELSATISVNVSKSGGETCAVFVKYGPLPDALTCEAVLAEDAVEGIVSGTIYGLEPGHAYYALIQARSCDGVDSVEVGPVRFETKAMPGNWKPSGSRGIVVEPVEEEAALAVTVGPGDSNSDVLYAVSGLTVGDVTATNGWSHCERLGEVPTEGGVFTWPLPEDWGDGSRVCRFFLLGGREGTEVSHELKLVTVNGQYVTTRVTPLASDTIEVKFAFKNGKGGNGTGCIYCARKDSSASGQTFTLMVMNAGEWRFDYGSTGQAKSIPTVLKDGTPQIARFSNGEGSIDGTPVAEGQPRDFTVGGALQLFASYTGSVGSGNGNQMSGDFYYLRLWDAEGNLKLDLVPWKDNDKVRIKDRVSNDLLIPQGGALGGTEFAADDVIYTGSSAMYWPVNARAPHLSDLAVCETGSGCAATVVGRVENADAVVVRFADETYEVAVTDGGFSKTIAGLLPGETYVWSVSATTEGGTDSSKEQTCVMPAGTEVGAITSQQNRRTFTLSGEIDHLGAGETTISFAVGAVGEPLQPVGEVFVFTNGVGLAKPSFSFDWRAPQFETDYTMALVVSNACSVQSWGQCIPIEFSPCKDRSTYFWQADGDGSWDGDWTDPAHWRSDWEEDGGLYPDSDSCVVSFNEVASAAGGAVLRLPKEEISISEFRADAANVKVRIAGSKESSLKIANGGELSIRGNGLSLTFDGLGEVELSNKVIMEGSNQRVTFKDTMVTSPSAGSTQFFIGSYYNGHVSHDNTLVVNNSTVTFLGDNAGIFLGFAGADAYNARLVVCGDDPQIVVSRISSSKISACPDRTTNEIVFEVPTNGYRCVPIVQNLSGNYAHPFMNNEALSALNLVVDPRSPIKDGTKRRVQLVDWPNGFADGTDGGAAVLLDMAQFKRLQGMTFQNDGKEVWLKLAPKKGFAVIIR